MEETIRAKLIFGKGGGGIKMTGKELAEKMILYRAKHSGVELAIIRAYIKKRHR